jgi:hypothetical protein
MVLDGIEQTSDGLVKFGMKAYCTPFSLIQVQVVVSQLKVVEKSSVPWVFQEAV